VIELLIRALGESANGIHFPIRECKFLFCTIIENITQERWGSIPSATKQNQTKNQLAICDNADGPGGHSLSKKAKQVRHRKINTA
jgi:hypothetical protein